MAILLPPTPMGVPPGHSFWNDWYEKLRTIVNEGSISVLWSNINFSGSSLTDLASRAHNNLQSSQGGTAGEFYHLTAAEYAALQAARSTRGVDTTDYVIVDDDATGLVLKSPDGHYWQIQVDNTGTLGTTDLGLTKP
jgi:hypothetical protein